MARRSVNGEGDAAQAVNAHQKGVAKAGIDLLIKAIRSNRRFVVWLGKYPSADLPIELLRYSEYLYPHEARERTGEVRTSFGTAQFGLFFRDACTGPMAPTTSSVVTTPNIKNRTLSNMDYSFEAAEARTGLNFPFRSRSEACQV
jgi:hypothetical protein